VFVATEDTYASGQYLLALQERGLVDKDHVHIIPLPTEDGKSALGALLDRLEARREDPTMVKLAEDEYWAIFDIDHHRADELAKNVERATVGGYHLAGSNPCFELWLLLHLPVEITGIPAAPDDRRAAKTCEDRLHQALQAGDPQARGYDKRSIGADRFAIREPINAACTRSRALMPATSEPWPQAVGTHVHLLIERLPLPPAPLPL